MAASSPHPLPPFADNDPPHAVPLALPAPLPLSSSAAAAPTPPSRRLPPPCWTPDETVALIDSYRDKWYSLRRGNLKATHWQDVADAVSLRCPSSSSAAKTAVQCRHKMEKLRKRYRTEIQRSRSIPSSGFTSSWAHFARMDAMEKGPTSAGTAVNNNDENPDDSEDEDNEEDQELYEELRRGSNMKSMSQMYRNGVGIGSDGGNGGGFRIRIPTGVSVAQPGSKAYYPKMDQKFVGGVNSYSPGPSYGSSAKVMRECGGNNNNVGGGRGAVLGKRERERDAVGEMVSAIKALGDGFVRTEQTKMEMAREIESMRMEMEMKRTEMILESQQRTVESFAKAVSEKRKKKMAKRMPPSPEA